MRGEQRPVDEREFLSRLHTDIVELQKRRAEYDISRPEILEIINVITEFLYGERDDLSAAEVLQVQFLPELADFEGLVKSSVCNHFEWTDAISMCADGSKEPMVMRNGFWCSSRRSWDYPPSPLPMNLKLRRRSNAPPLDRAAPIHQRAISQSRFY